MRLIDADALKDVIHQHDYPLADKLNSIDNGMFTLGIFQAIDQMPAISIDDVRGKENAKLENSVKLLVAAFDLAKEKLEKYRHAAFVIGETCVDESKGHISPEDAIKKIRESIYYDNTASCYDALEEVV